MSTRTPTVSELSILHQQLNQLATGILGWLLISVGGYLLWRYSTARIVAAILAAVVLTVLLVRIAWGE